MRVFSLLFLIVLVAALSVLAYENDYNTTVSLLRWEWKVPFPLVIAAVYVLGMLTGWAILGAVKRSWRRVTEVERA